MNSSLPPSLVRFEDELERAVERDVRTARPVPATRRAAGGRRRTVLVMTLSGVAAVAIAVAALLVTGLGSGTQRASARQIEARAAAALPDSADTILHIAVTKSDLAADGSVAAVQHVQSWQQQGGERRMLQIVQAGDGPVLEQGFPSNQIYDQTHDTSYPSSWPASNPRYTVVGSTAHVTTPNGTQTIPLTTDQVQGLKDGADQIDWTVDATGGHAIQATVFPTPTRGSAHYPDPWSADFVSQLRALLSSGAARVTDATTSAGQPAEKIVISGPVAGGQTDYYVDPHTYVPLQMDTSGSLVNGQYAAGGVSRYAFTTWEELPLSGNEGLLTLSVPSSATVDSSPGDYFNALDRYESASG